MFRFSHEKHIGHCFQMTFDNGVEISLSNTKSSYNDGKGNAETKTLEVALFNSNNGKNITNDVLPDKFKTGGGYVGWLDPKDVLEVMNIAEAYNE